MAKTTEELKREMYTKLRHCKVWGEQHLQEFEDSFEEYLEALRREAEILKIQVKSEGERGGIILDAYHRQQDLTMQARADADTERNRAQAFEYANKSAGEFLQEARTKIKAQRQSIGQLKNERDNAVHAAKVRTSQRDGLEAQLLEARKELTELRKSVSATRIQDSGENAPETKCGAAQVKCHRCFDTGFCVWPKDTLLGWQPVRQPCFKCDVFQRAICR